MNRNDKAIKPRVLRFQDLTRFRVRHILLVSNLYDSFILTEDGQLNEALLKQYASLQLSRNPDITRVSTGRGALTLATVDDRFDLIITSLRVGDMNAVELSDAIHEAGLDIPVVLMGFDNRALTDFIARHDTSSLAGVFLWQGDASLLLAIVKSIEDRVNVAHDTGVCGVPAILVVEDNPRFYSSFLPMMYAELMAHSRALISEGLNLSQKELRFRARPKILMCTRYEQAWGYFERYGQHILGIISDIQYSREGRPDNRAGLELAKQVRATRFDVPIVLQSSFPESKTLAEKADAWFLLKGSPVLLKQLRDILNDSFGFGSFKFRLPNGTVVGEAHDLKSLVEMIGTVPAESLGFHSRRNHFSNWLKARTEFALAKALRPRKVSDFTNLEELRQDLMASISGYRLERDRVIVADYQRDSFDFECSITRIGSGSLGGKARGLAFMNRMLNESTLVERYPQVDITVPSAVVLGTDVYDQFMRQADLWRFAIESESFGNTRRRMMAARFPDEALEDLRDFLARVDCPLAVRSSGLLEDSPYQPFAGIYRTFMLPNNHPDPEVRLKQLVDAVRGVYASTFTNLAKDFLAMTPFRLEEEKMAVIIQRLVGVRHDNRYYPDFSGTARSRNYYPVAPAEADDGIVAVAMGLGRTVVDGGNCLRFCPKYPRHVVSFSSVDDVLNNSQREFYALDLDESPGRQGGEGVELSSYSLDVAECDGTLSRVGSAWSAENDAIYDGLSRPGVRLVSFASVLKHGSFPLAELAGEVLKLGAAGTNCPVEIEFAVNLSVPPGEKPEFGLLQMRPLAVVREVDELEIGQAARSDLVCSSEQVMGNGVIDDIQDIVMVDYHRFDRLRSRQTADIIARHNGILQAEGRPYLLIGVGRWGSADPFLGIPVSWNQVAGARVIVEAGFRDFKVAPSQGTHFFQNLTSCNVGYFTVNPEAGEGFVDWDWLTAQQAQPQPDDGNSPVRHLRFEEPLVVRMSGKSGEGVVLKPGCG